MAEWVQEIKSFLQLWHNDAKVSQQPTLKGNSLIHDPTSGVNNECIKALDDAYKGIMTYAEQVSLALIHHHDSSKDGSTVGTSTHNHKLLEATQYFDSLMDLKNRGVRVIGH